MAAWKPHSFYRSVICILLLASCAQSNALARAGGFPHEPRWSLERINYLPSEVQNSARHMCGMKPTAAHYLATSHDNARIIRLHFERFSCEGPQLRDDGLCLNEEFVLSGSRYRLSRNYYARCDD